MPQLTDTDWTKLTAVARSREGREINGTHPPNGDDPWAFACWVWAVVGAPVPSGHVAHMDEFYTALATFGGLAFSLTGFNTACANTPNVNDAMAARNFIATNYNRANADAPGARLACRKVLLGLALIRAGVQPSDPHNAQRYQIVARYDETSDPWYARPQHFAVALIPSEALRRFGRTESFVQKVPSTGVRYSCSSVWDEGYQEMRFGVPELTQHQLTVLQRASPFDQQL